MPPSTGTSVPAVKEATLERAVSAKPERRLFPRGLGHFLLQIGIWLGFYLAYKVARGIADDRAFSTRLAFDNGRWVINFEERAHALFEISLQQLLLSSRLLIDLATATYWLSQFVVLGLALLWVYFRRHEAFARFRNWVMLANMIGLVGYVLVPTAPPRMFPGAGFLDVNALFSSVNSNSRAVSALGNPYAAMPSLHAADALIVGVSLALVTRRWWVRALWLAWPAWVWFTVMATGNHFWMDVAAGVLVALIAAPVVDSRLRPWGRDARRPESEPSAA
ncbi:MAG: phosphatase PAP2 family protein [Gaiellaceae bacterium]